MTEPVETSPADASQDQPRMPCADVLQRGDWERLDLQQLRWKWTGSEDCPLSELLGEAVPAKHLQSFPSARQGEFIWVYRCQDGGVISYQLQTGRWLHTLNGLAAFRERVYQLNLVPLAELGELLDRHVE